MKFIVRIDVPDFLVHALGKDLEHHAKRHAEDEIRLNNCVPLGGDYSFSVSMLPDDPSGLTNFSRLYLEMGIGGGFAEPWKTMRYPGREAYQSRLER